MCCYCLEAAGEGSCSYSLAYSGAEIIKWDLTYPPTPMYHLYCSSDEKE